MTLTTPETRIGIDSPAGFIEAFTEWDSDRVGRVRFLNVLSFLYARDVIVTTPSFGDVEVDIAFGGAFYAYLSGSQVGLAVRPDHYQRLIQLGDEVKNAVAEKVNIQHPLIPELNRLYGTIIDGAPQHRGSSQANVCIFADREVDRSPTGTAGRVVQLFARGQLGKDDVLVNESIIGTTFQGRVAREVKVGEFDAVIPEISSEAFLTGFNQWVIDPRDPVGKGFFLR